MTECNIKETIIRFLVSTSYLKLSTNINKTNYNEILSQTLEHLKFQLIELNNIEVED